MPREKNESSGSSSIRVPSTPRADAPPRAAAEWKKRMSLVSKALATSSNTPYTKMETK